MVQHIYIYAGEPESYVSSSGSSELCRTEFLYDVDHGVFTATPGRARAVSGPKPISTTTVVDLHISNMGN